ncbi:MAG: hypothetical protein Q7T82_17160 [Armatimonadota bacterium]|nr:hypothetical protein [Armatimonadota bacterium]
METRQADRLMPFPRDRTLEPMELAAGDHELTIEVTGKQKESLGHRIGVDAVWLSAPR